MQKNTIVYKLLQNRENQYINEPFIIQKIKKLMNSIALNISFKFSNILVDLN